MISQYKISTECLYVIKLIRISVYYKYNYTHARAISCSIHSRARGFVATKTFKNQPDFVYSPAEIFHIVEHFLNQFHKKQGMKQTPKNKNISNFEHLNYGNNVKYKYLTFS